MTNAETPPVIPVREAASGPSEAVVSAVLDRRTARVETRSGSVDAVVATVGDYRPTAGDRVLLIEGKDGAWIVGVVGSLRPVPRAGAAPVRTRDGVTAEVECDDARLVVRAAGGEVIFTHDATTGRSEVRAPELRVRSTDGDLSLESARTVRIQGRKVELSAGQESLAMDAETGTRLASQTLRALVGEGRLTVKNAIFGAEQLESAVKRSRHFADVAEVRVGRLVERAKDVFREVEGVSQTRAGRIRTVARGAYHLLSERATIRAEDDLALMGEKISLA